MTVTSANDINALRNVSSNAIKDSLYNNSNTNSQDNQDMFSSILHAAADNISETNGYLSDQENEELKRLIGDGSGNDDAIIERAARDDLGYARPSERIFYDISGK